MKVYEAYSVAGLTRHCAGGGYSLYFIGWNYDKFWVSHQMQLLYSTNKLGIQKERCLTLYRFMKGVL